MPQLVLTIRRPRNFPMELAVKRRYILDSTIYSMETAAALLNYAITRNTKVYFSVEGMEEDIVFNPEDLQPRNPTLGGGAVGLMYEDLPPALQDSGMGDLD